MREWLSGGVSPCQGEGRGFESRLALFYCKNAYSGFAVGVFWYVMDKPTWICYSRGKKNPLNGEGEKEEQHGAY